MTQVLHLLPSEPDLQASRLAAALRRSSDRQVEIVTRTIGRGGDYRNVAHAVAALRLGRGPTFDVVHAWDRSTLIAATRGEAPVIYSLSDSAARLPAGFRAQMMYRQVHLVSTTHAGRAACMRRQMPPDRCHVISPPVDFGSIRQGRNEAFRQALGLGPEELAILVPEEPAGAGRHGLALHIVSILHVLEPRYRILLWGRGEHVAACGRLARKLKQPKLIVQAERQLGRRVEFEELLSAADMALVTARQAEPAYPMALCMAAGLPIVAGLSVIVKELLSDGRSATIAPTFQPRDLAQRVMKLAENPARAASLGEAAAADARRQFDPSRVVEEYRLLYRRVAGPCHPGVEPRRDSALSTMTVTGPSLAR